MNKLLDEIEIVQPAEIEKRSFEIITGILGDREFPKMHGPIIKRVIHTTADFDYADTVKISDGAVEKAMSAIKEGSPIFTDTMMAASGINKKLLGKWGGQVTCLIGDENVAEEAKARGITRSAVCMEKYVGLNKYAVFAVGNAPTALLRLSELIRQGKAAPALVVGVPVGFVNVIEAKKILMDTGVPYIVAEGRKGGSNVAAAIVNAILYMMRDGSV